MSTQDTRTAIVFLHYFGGSAREWDGLTAAVGASSPASL
jgi:hypothetical protein